MIPNNQFINSLKELNLKGFGGYCGIAAAALRDTYYKDAIIVGAFNNALFEHEHYIGHVALRFETELGPIYLDFDGYIKDEEQITSWSSLDSEDPDYIELMDTFGIDKTDQNFEESVLVELSTEDAIHIFGIRDATSVYLDYVNKIKEITIMNSKDLDLS